MTTAKQIRADILSGEFKDGFTRELADHYGVKTQTARNALLALAAEFDEDSDGPWLMFDIPEGPNRGGVTGGCSHIYWSLIPEE